MRVRNLPWGRCSKAIRGKCNNPCGHYMAHHIPAWGDCWCHCEPITLPPAFKSWAAYNRMLMLRLTVEDVPMHTVYRYDRAKGERVAVGKKLCSRPQNHDSEPEFRK